MVNSRTEAGKLIFFFSFFKSNLQVHLWKGVIHLNVFNIEKEEDLLLVTVQYNPDSLASMEPT